MDKIKDIPASDYDYEFMVAIPLADGTFNGMRIMKLQKPSM